VRGNWKQWHGKKSASVMCTNWQIGTDYQQKTTFVTNMRKMKNLSLLQTTIGTWVRPTKRTECLTAIQLVREHGCGQKKLFFHLLDSYTTIILW
jgi:hypothetical protein